jgi:hypothetical protein
MLVTSLLTLLVQTRSLPATQVKKYPSGQIVATEFHDWAAAISSAQWRTITTSSWAGTIR